MQNKLEVANKVAEALKATGKFRSPRIWTPEGGTMVRVYTGAKNEFYEIADDLTAIRCRKNMDWSHLLGDAMKAVGVKEDWK